MQHDDPFSAQPTAGSTEEQPLTVSELTARVKDLLEGTFPSVWVSGEISNLSRPQSGHCYLTIKDNAAQLRAVMWRNTAARLTVDPADGMEVICQGSLDVYAPRGSYQLVIRQLMPKGVGALEQALRRLKQKLHAEGLFEASHKKPLPRFPRQIVMVTSPTGAAVHDFIQVLRRRWRGANVLVVPTRVQGEGAAQEIARAIESVNRLTTPVDVLVVGRGGGSLEDLWAFNEEPVVRAIFASRIPVVSAVGHEIDVTLADLVADIRALTPTEAAERVVPDEIDIAAALGGLRQRLSSGLRGRAAAARSRLDALASRRVLRRPYDSLRDRQRRLDDLGQRAARAARNVLNVSAGRLTGTTAQLDSLSPLNVLGRGYTLTYRGDDSELVMKATDLSVGDQIVTQFSEGQAVSSVDEIKQDN